MLNDGFDKMSDEELKTFYKKLFEEIDWKEYVKMYLEHEKYRGVFLKINFPENKLKKI